MTDIMYNMDEIEQSIEYMKKAIKLRPTNTNYLTALATLYEEILDIETAKKYYFKVIEIDPINNIAKKRLKNL
jgi:tetratricopeptide (TPR) repeat protein